MSIEKTREVPETVLESGVAEITTLTVLLRGDVERATVNAGLSQPMALALGRLTQLPDQSTVGALARSLGCNMGNLSGTLERLEKAGCIERFVGPADRRARLIRVTPKGRKVTTQITRNFQRGRVCSALKRMSRQELEVLTEMIRRLNAVADTEGPL
jgi:DNA-binding MarR family transcriptional regulator